MKATKKSVQKFCESIGCEFGKDPRRSKTWFVQSEQFQNFLRDEDIALSSDDYRSYIYSLNDLGFYAPLTGNISSKTQDQWEKEILELIRKKGLTPKKIIKNMATFTTIESAWRAKCKAAHNENEKVKYEKAQVVTADSEIQERIEKVTMRAAESDDAKLSWYGQNTNAIVADQYRESFLAILKQPTVASMAIELAVRKYLDFSELKLSINSEYYKRVSENKSCSLGSVSDALKFLTQDWEIV